MRYIILTLLGFILLTACKKDKDDDEVSLKGKWTVESFIFKDYENGVLVDTESELGFGASFDFQDNGSLVIMIPGEPTESLPYTILPDSKVNIDGEIMEIQNLTRSSVTLYQRDDYGQGDYIDLFVNLKR